MRVRQLLYILFFISAGMPALTARCQTDAQAFRSAQLSTPRVAQAMAKYTDTLSREFRKKGINWPATDIFIRAFKSQNEMELWARNSPTSEYRHIKTWRICAITGLLGPKRYQGDHQVPEGFYFIEEFNAHSDYYLSMLLNYPNASDKAAAIEKLPLGGDIYIHGGCVTIGCLPMTDAVIQEVYAVCLTARLNGQEYIPVHIYPTRLTKPGLAYLAREYPNDKNRQQFWNSLRPSFDYFEKTHKLLPVMYTADGKYAN